MADEVDMTAERMAREETHLVAASRKPDGPQPTGHCLYCDEELILSAARWCDADCRDEWAREKERGLR